MEARSFLSVASYWVAPAACRAGQSQIFFNKSAIPCAFLDLSPFVFLLLCFSLLWTCISSCSSLSVTCFHPQQFDIFLVLESVVLWPCLCSCSSPFVTCFHPQQLWYLPCIRVSCASDTAQVCTAVTVIEPSCLGCAGK